MERGLIIVAVTQREKIFQNSEIFFICRSWIEVHRKRRITKIEHMRNSAETRRMSYETRQRTPSDRYFHLVSQVASSDSREPDMIWIC